MTVLHLTLKKQWYDMILSGEKTEEYREIKPYWVTRLEGRRYTHVVFKNGYSRNARTMVATIVCIAKGRGKPQWGGTEQQVYIIKLGQVTETFSGGS